MSAVVLEKNQIDLDNYQGTGIGEDADRILQILKKAAQHYLWPMSRYSYTEVFYDLALTWEKETEFFSSIADICTHPAYQKIIGMGNKAVPLILRKLEDEPAHWFWALSAITGVNPILHEHAGNIKAMREDWLSWGKGNDYQW